MKKIFTFLSMLLLLNSAMAETNLSEVEKISSRSGAVSPVVNSKQRIEPQGSFIFFEDFQTQVDPLNPALPAGWVVVNVDGLTPNANVSQFTDAWIAAVDFDDNTNFNVQSTSWYTPAGQADDWLITPAISLGANSILSWLGEGQDAAYPDGYEVYVSTTTQDVAGCQANPTVFSIPAESGAVYTEHVVNLLDAGYSNQSVYICYRNNSNDQFILMLDDILVVEGLDNNVEIDAVAAAPEYTQVPEVLMAYEIPLSVDFSNSGLLPQSDMLIKAEVFLDMALVSTITEIYPGPLAPAASDSLVLDSYIATDLGIYDVVYTVTLDGVADENPGDNEVIVSNVTEITSDTMSRDDGEVNTGSLSIGVGNDGYLGNMYEFNEPVTVSGIQFIHNNLTCDPGPECTLDGLTLRVDVFAINTTTGLPDVMVGSSEDYVVPAGSATGTVVDLSFPGNLNLAPGEYVFALLEPESANVQLHTTENRFTAGTAWVVFPLDPIGTWGNNEDFNFFNTYYMRPKFIETDLIYKNGFE